MYLAFVSLPEKQSGIGFQLRLIAETLGPLFLEHFPHDGPAGLSPAARSTLSSK